MNGESINRWVDKAKQGSSEGNADDVKGVQVVRREATVSKGQMIMDAADKILPGLQELLRGVRDNSGMLLQPAHIRGIALRMAQGLVANHSKKNNA